MKKKFKIGVTNGCFDLLHKGHIYSLKQAKKYCNKLIVLLNSNKSVRKLKGKNRPYNSITTRIENLKKTSLVDKIYVFKEKTPLKLIKKIRPDIIVKGSDYDYKNVVGSKISNVILFDKKNNLSTTKILNKIKRF